MLPSSDLSIPSHQAASLIGVTQQTIRNYIRAGNLVAQRDGPRGHFEIKASEFSRFCLKYDLTIDTAPLHQHISLMNYLLNNCPHNNSEEDHPWPEDA